MTRINLKRISLLISLFVFCCGIMDLAKAEIVVQDGQTIAFLGDSITALGYKNPTGFVNLVVSGLQANGIKVTAIPAGIGGHRSDQMLKRLSGVLDKHPDWLVLSCGVNDVWHGDKGVPLNAYKANIAAIVDQCQRAGVKVLILTTTVIGEELNNDYNLKLASYNAYLRAVAEEKNCRLADINAMFQKRLGASSNPVSQLTTDGVHMNPEGDRVMAEGILRTFGLNAKQLKKAKDSW